MAVFEDMFRKSGGRPFAYKGRTISLMDYFPVSSRRSLLRFRFVSTESEWRQGISLDTDEGFKFAGDDTLLKSVVLWEDTAPPEGEFVCISKSGMIDVKNVWDTGNGAIDSWHNGAAMWAEEIPRGRRYHCNDGHPDDDFADIVFELVIVSTEE